MRLFGYCTETPMSVDQWQMSRVGYAGCRIDKSEKDEVVSDWGYYV
jgi:hypothetical protein